MTKTSVIARATRKATSLFRPTDHYQDLRTEMVLKMIAIGMDVECQHHEVATAGQAEIDLRFNTLLNSADNMMKYKYIIKNTAAKAGKTVTFMPKPIFSDNGSGMHTHQSLWKGASRSSPATATRACRRWRCGTRADCSSTPARFPPSSLPARTPTSAWCPATKPR